MACNDEGNLSQSLLLLKVHAHVTAVTRSTAKTSSICRFKKGTISFGALLHGYQPPIWL